MGDLRLQRSERRGLSSFLAEHETCGEGFDIQRRDSANGSVVRVICNRCSEVMEYPAATSAGSVAEPPALAPRAQRRVERRRTPTPNLAGDASAANAAQARSTGNGGPLGPPPPDSSHPPAPSPVNGGTSLWPGWLSTAGIAALIGGGLLMVVLGLFSSDDSGSGPTEPTLQSSAQSRNAPTPSPPQGGAKPSTSGVELTRHHFADRVAVGVPRGWSSGISDGAVTIADADHDCQVQIYYQSGVRPDAQLGRETREFLLNRHAGARIQGPTDAREADRPALLVRSHYRGGSESAWAFTAGGYTYLALKRISGDAPPNADRRSDAIVASIRPL